MRWKVNKDVFAGDYSAIRTLSQFDNVKEMDTYINSFLYFNKDELSTTAYDLVQYVRKFIYKNRSGIGVCTSKKDAIAKKLECHPRSISRAIKQLFQLGFISEPFQTWDKKNKAAGHLVLVISKINDIVLEPWKKKDVTPVVPAELSLHEDVEMPCESKDEPIKNDSESIILTSNNSKEFKEQLNSKENVPNELIPDLTFSKEDIPEYVPSEFIEYVWSKNLKNPIAITDYWKGAVNAYCKTYQLHFSKLDFNQFEEIIEHACEAFRITEGNINNFQKQQDSWFKQFGAFFYGVCKRRFKKAYKAAIALEKQHNDFINSMVTPVIESKWDSFQEWRKNKIVDPDMPC